MSGEDTSPTTNVSKFAAAGTLLVVAAIVVGGIASVLANVRGTATVGSLALLGVILVTVLLVGTRWRRPETQYW